MAFADADDDSSRLRFLFTSDGFLMLNASEIQYIAKHGWIMDHDWQLLSTLIGEPFLLHDLICYFDGKHFVLCTWPVRQSLSKADIEQRCNSAVEECFRRFSPKLIETWGPFSPRLERTLPSDWSVFEYVPASLHNVNVQIDFANYEMPKNRNVQNARQAQSRGYKAIIGRRRQLGWQHLRLMQLFLTRDDLTAFDRTYNAAASALSLASESVMVEAYDNEKLLGFIMVREVLNKIAIATWAFYSREISKVSDFLQFSMIEHYQKGPFSILDLGYSAHVALLEYKRRWGVNVNHGGFAAKAYHQSDYIPACGHRHWWAREIVCGDRDQ